LRGIGHLLAERIRGAKALELGSGTGILGITAALLGAHVVLSDVPAVLPVLLSNTSTNRLAAERAGGSMQVVALDWTCPRCTGTDPVAAVPGGPEDAVACGERFAEGGEAVVDGRRRADGVGGSGNGRETVGAGEGVGRGGSGAGCGGEMGDEGRVDGGSGAGGAGGGGGGEGVEGREWGGGVGGARDGCEGEQRGESGGRVPRGSATPESEEGTAGGGTNVGGRGRGGEGEGRDAPSFVPCFGWGCGSEGELGEGRGEGEMGPFNLILGGDLVYSEKQIPHLLEVLRELMREAVQGGNLPEMVLGHKSRSDAVDRALFEGLKALGFRLVPAGVSSRERAVRVYVTPGLAGNRVHVCDQCDAR
jgi:Lysine methyltransferase